MATVDTFRDETMAAIFAEFDRARAIPEPMWVMSKEWFEDIRRMLQVPPVGGETQMLGLPIVIREGAGFARLIPSSEVPA